MDMNQIMTFQAVVKQGSLSKAAVELNISQPSVTRHIQGLEKELGVSLIVHGKRPVQLTIKGATIAQFAPSLIADLEQLKTLANGNEMSGDVTVATTEALVSRQLLRVVGTFRDKYPQNKVFVRSGTMSESLDLVASGRADMAVIPSYGVPPEFYVTPLFPVHRILITPLGHPLLETTLTSLSQLARYPLIFRRVGSHPFTIRTTLEAAFRGAGVSYEIIGEFDRLDLIKQAVAEGIGISVINEMSLEPFEYERFGVLPLNELLSPIGACIVTLNKQLAKPIAKYFLELLGEYQHPMFQGRPGRGDVPA